MMELNAAQRPQNDALDSIIGIAFPVLDDGFVRLVDYMGTDESIVQAARISYGGKVRKQTEDSKLLRYLMRHRHTTPFEMCEIKLHLRVPMDIWRQWIRHRTANINEYSTRYSVAIDAASKTKPSEWRMQAAANKQGSEGELPGNIGEILTRREAEIQNASRQIYEERLQYGVAKEQARKDLPLSTYTEAFWKIDLHNLLHFLELRMESHSQLEIQQYAKTIGYEIVSKWLPITWQAFLEYRYNSMSLSQYEITALSLLCKNNDKEAIDFLANLEWLSHAEDGWKPSREAKEFGEKLARLGIAMPWE